MRLTHRPFRILGSLLLPVSILMGLATMPTLVHAAAPQHVNFSGTAPNVDLCGINTTQTFTGVDNFFPVFNSSGTLIAFKDIHQEQDTFTAANGKSIVSHFAEQVTQTVTKNPDGTVTYVTTYKGLPEQIMNAHGPVLTRDAGIIQFLDVFDSSGTLISQTMTVENGPHPDADSGFTLFCQVVTAALT